MMPIDYTPLILSLKVSLFSTLLVLVLGTLAAWKLTTTRIRGKIFIETFLTLPLVLPPSVVGFILLFILGRGSVVGQWLNNQLGIHLLFTWQAAVIAAAIMSFPLMVKSAESAMKSIDIELIEIAKTLGASEWRIFTDVLIPCSYRGLLTGGILAFARGLGEFGATLMVAGNIPGLTQTLPLALYSSVQSGDYHTATIYAAILTIIAFVILWAVGLYQAYLSAIQPKKTKSSN